MGTNTPSSKICLFGGSFDPIHAGHLHVAELARASLGLDKVIFIPCKQSPHKLYRDTAPDKDRKKMCELAIRHLTWSSVHDFELSSPSPSYSWRTAEFFRQTYAHSRLFWLMGTDQWNALLKWSRHEHLATLVDFITCTRGNEVLSELPYCCSVISTEHPASSTKIRQAIQEGKKPQWLDPEVLHYITERGLYT
jgi:nicotinate-nucleotide adenylyltransferase